MSVDHLISSSLRLMIRRFPFRLMRYLRKVKQIKLLRAGDRRSSVTFHVSGDALRKLIGCDRSFIIAPTYNSPRSSATDLYLRKRSEGLSLENGSLLVFLLTFTRFGAKLPLRLHRQKGRDTFFPPHPSFSIKIIHFKNNFTLIPRGPAIWLLS